MWWWAWLYLMLIYLSQCCSLHVLCCSVCVCVRERERERETAFYGLFLYSNNQQEAGLVVRNILTHLLDISWQEYDYLLLRDAQLPEFLFTSAVSKLTNGHVMLLTYCVIRSQNCCLPFYCCFCTLLPPSLLLICFSSFALLHCLFRLRLLPPFWDFPFPQDPLLLRTGKK